MRLLSKRTAAPDAARLIPISTKMLPVPTAAATRLATIGMIDWPMRLAMVRSEFAVPMAPPLAMASTPAMLAVIEMLSANPATAMAAYNSGNGKGKARSESFR